PTPRSVWSCSWMLMDSKPVSGQSVNSDPPPDTSAFIGTNPEAVRPACPSFARHLQPTSKRGFLLHSASHALPTSVLQNRSNEIQGTWVLRLSEPEDCFLAHDRIAILARLIDDQ